MDLLPEILVLFQKLVNYQDHLPDNQLKPTGEYKTALYALFFLARSGYGDKQQLDQIAQHLKSMRQGVRVFDSVEEAVALAEIQDGNFRTLRELDALLAEIDRNKNSALERLADTNTHCLKGVGLNENQPCHSYPYQCECECERCKKAVNQMVRSYLSKMRQ